MGACIRFPAPPPPVKINLPGGAKLVSQAEDSHDPCGPVSNIFRMSAPVFGAAQPVFDIIGFIMVLVEFQMVLMAILGAMLALTGNPALAAMFPMPTIVNTDDNEPLPNFPAGDTGVPDVSALIDSLMKVLCKALKLAGLVPQLSVPVTIKDSLMALLPLMSCVQAKMNSIQDAMTMVPKPIGDPVVDQEIACAQEAMSDFMAHAAGPLVNVIPVMQMLGKMAEPLQQGLPPPVANLIRSGVNLGLLPFPDDDAKAQFLDLVARLEEGTLIEIPDFSDISDISAKMDEIRTKLGPVLGAIEQVQKLTEKLQNC